MPVATWISNAHDVENTTYFVRALSEISKKRIQKIETDGSLTLLQACCNSFNYRSIFEYMKLIFKAVVDKIDDALKELEKLTVIHICGIHTIKRNKKKVNACFAKKNRWKKNSSPFVREDDSFS